MVSNYSETVEELVVAVTRMSHDHSLDVDVAVAGGTVVMHVVVLVSWPSHHHPRPRPRRPTLIVYRSNGIE